MFEVLKWWRARTSQLLVLCTFALLLVWQNYELRRSERTTRQVVAQVRESYRLQETIREVQFARMLRSIEARFSALDEAMAKQQPSHSIPHYGPVTRHAP